MMIFARNSLFVKIGLPVAFLFLGLGLGILYAGGYRLGSFGVSTPGLVAVSIPVSGVSVYLDDKEQKVTSKPGEIVSFSLPSGVHTILLTKEGYWPWQKQIKIEKGATLSFNAFLSPKSVNGSFITGDDPEYGALISLVSSAKIPRSGNPIVSPDDLMSAWIEGNELKALSRGGEAVSVLPDAASIRSLAFYPGRSDVLLVASGPLVKAIEIDLRGGQNTYEIYKGSAPSFALISGNLFLVDEGVLSELSL